MAAPLIDQAIDRIRQLIMSSVLQPGSRLPPENELATMLGCSRSTTREAVRSLVTARVLDVRRGDGTYVTSLEPHLLLEGLGFALDLVSDESLTELWELRRLLEPVTVAKAALRINESDLDRLDDALGHMRRARDIADLMCYDSTFHEIVIAAAGNETVATVLATVSARLARARFWHGVAIPGALDSTVAQHAEILDALRARDSERAQAAALLHIARNEAWLVDVVKSSQQREQPAGKPRAST